MADWQINKPLGQCYGTGKQIEPGQTYYATLVQTEDRFQRRDFSQEYWQNEKPQVYCYWKTTMPHPQQKKKFFIDDQMLMAFFDRLAEETDQEKINFRFVLAMILMRKKRLKYESTKKRDEKEIWVLRKPGEKEYIDSQQN